MEGMPSFALQCMGFALIAHCTHKMLPNQYCKFQVKLSELSHQKQPWKRQSACVLLLQRFKFCRVQYNWATALSLTYMTAYFRHFYQILCISQIRTWFHERFVDASWLSHSHVSTWRCVFSCIMQYLSPFVSDRFPDVWCNDPQKATLISQHQSVLDPLFTSQAHWACNTASGAMKKSVDHWQSVLSLLQVPDWRLM